MSQNRSNAVMASRVEAHDSLDFFPTPPWATRALCEWLRGVRCNLSTLNAWEPACGRGDMAAPLSEYFKSVRASDVHDYGFGEWDDFLFHDPKRPRVDWIITNPPFRLGQQFVERAMRDASEGVAMLVRTAFLESAERHSRMFSVTPPTEVLQFVERVPMFKGRLDRHGSTATAYCWLVWRHRPLLPINFGTRFHWIAPCRKRLERDSDYPAEAASS